MVRAAGPWNQNRFCGRTALAGFATWLKVRTDSCISVPATCIQRFLIILATIGLSEHIHKKRGAWILPAPRPMIRSVAIVIVIFVRPGLIWQRQQELGDVAFISGGKAEIHATVVVVNHVSQGCKATVVVEAALLMRPQSVKRSGAITVIRRAAGLEVINANLGSSVHVPARFSVERRNVAGAALGFAVEECFAARRGCRIKAALWRRRCSNIQLIDMQRAELGSDQVDIIVNVAKSSLRGHREFAGII